MKKLIVFVIFIICCSNIKAQQTKKDIISDIISHVNPDTIYSYIEHLQNYVTRDANMGNRKQIANWIKNKFISYGYTAELDSFQSELFSVLKWQYNVVAHKIGSVQPDKSIIIGGHYDSRSYTADAPGADDNASGVAGVLEAARAIANQGYQSNFTLKFVAFAAEEYGLFGSKYMADKAKNNNDVIEMMINCDMISHEPDTNHLNWKFLLMDSVSSPAWLLSFARNVNQNYTNLIAIDSSITYGDSDHTSFINDGYPAIWLFEHNICPFIHSEHDSIKYCNKNYAAIITKLATAMILKGDYQFLDVPNAQLNNELLLLYPNPTSDLINIYIYMI